MMTGTRITSVNDPLQKIKIDQLYQLIVHPAEALRQQIKRLRMIRTMDERQYQQRKKELPYFVCARFHPPYRRTDHFASTRYFVVDLDHFAEAGKDLNTVRQQLTNDERVVLGFTSPGGDGLKLLFGLEAPCYDPGLYKLFYKAFLRRIAKQYQLEKLVDARTHDVTRACFLSADPQACYRPAATLVSINAYIDPEDPDAVRSVQEDYRALKAETLQSDTKPEKPPLDVEILEQIKRQLNPDFKPRKRRNLHVTPELEARWTNIESCLQEAGIEVKKAESIQYGKKLQLTMGQFEAQLNVFYGKKGFSVVKTTKRKNHPELLELAYQLLIERLE